MDLRLPSLGEMLLIMEHILEDMVPLDGILTTLTMKELAIVVDKKSQDYFSIFNFSSFNSSYFSLILLKLSFLLSYRKINFIDIFLKTVLLYSDHPNHEGIGHLKIIFQYSISHCLILHTVHSRFSDTFSLHINCH